MFNVDIGSIDFIGACGRKSIRKEDNLILNDLVDTAREWCRGKNWIIRLPLVIYLIYIFVRYLNQPNYFSILCEKLRDVVKK